MALRHLHSSKMLKVRKHSVVGAWSHLTPSFIKVWHMHSFLIGRLLCYNIRLASHHVSSGIRLCASLLATNMQHISQLFKRRPGTLMHMHNIHGTYVHITMYDHEHIEAQCATRTCQAEQASTQIMVELAQLQTATTLRFQQPVKMLHCMQLQLDKGRMNVVTCNGGRSGH